MTKEAPNYYAIIPANIRYDKNLKANEKLLYWEITCLAQKSWKCFASNKYFAELYWVTNKCVSGWINHLKKLWYINVQLIYAEGSKQIVNRYITFVPDPMEQNVNTPMEQKVIDNNTSINNTSNNIINKKQYFSDNELNEKFNDFLINRKDLYWKKINTELSIKWLVNKINKLWSCKEHKILMIDNAINWGWKSIFECKYEEKWTADEFVKIWYDDFKKLYWYELAKQRMIETC